MIVVRPFLPPAARVSLGVLLLAGILGGAARGDLTDVDGDGLPDGWERGVGRYEIVRGTFSWEQARLNAISRGGHLATVIHSTEWADMKSVLGPEMFGKNLWLGGTDERSEGRWTWVTGEKFDFSNWRAGEPNNDSLGTGHGAPENYLVIWGRETAQQDGQAAYWNDVPITGGVIARDGYILERGSWTDPDDRDTDHDGLLDAREAPFLPPYSSPTDANNSDSDGDGLSDGDEVLQYRTDPASVDTDHDGLSDFDELRRLGTDPRLEDTDGDGLLDGAELYVHHTDPLKQDTDGDGFPDGEEIASGTDPKDPKSSLQLQHRQYTAVEILVPTKVGEFYQIQTLTTAGTWQNQGAKFAGNGDVRQFLFSTRQVPRKYWRVILSK